MDLARYDYRSLFSLVVLLLLVTQGDTFQASPHTYCRNGATKLKSMLGDHNDGATSIEDNESNKVSSVERSRRAFFSQSLGVLTSASIAVEAANANPSIISSIQGPIQDIVSPGHWIGQFVGINSKTVQWKFPNATPEQVSKALVAVLKDLTPEQKSKLYIPNFDISRADSNKVHVRTWTKNEWLDSLDVTFSEQKSSTIATASFYATGFFPTIIPGAPILNVGMAWMPFASPGPEGQMLQDYRLYVLEKLVAKRLQQASSQQQQEEGASL